MSAVPDAFRLDLIMVIGNVSRYSLEMKKGEVVSFIGPVHCSIVALIKALCEHRMQRSFCDEHVHNEWCAKYDETRSSKGCWYNFSSGGVYAGPSNLLGEPESFILN